MNPYIRPVRQKLLPIYLPNWNRFVALFPADRSLYLYIKKRKGRQPQLRRQPQHSVENGESPQTNRLFLIFEIHFNFIFRPFHIFSLSPFSLLTLLHALHQLFPVEIYVRRIIDNFSTHLFPNSPKFFIHLPVLIDRHPLLQVLFISIGDVLFQVGND